MSHKSKSHHAKPFTGPVELIHPAPRHIEFVDAHRLWAFPIAQLNGFVLEENPEHHGKRSLPPDQLVLNYATGTVILKGWRLELLAGPLATGRVARIHAEKHLGALILDEAWVSEIHVAPNENVRLAEGGPDNPVTARKHS